MASQYSIPDGWVPVTECQNCGSNIHRSLSEIEKCPRCGSDKLNQLKPEGQYLLLGKCPYCEKDLYAYRKTTDINASHVPKLAKSILSCIYCQKILGVSEKAPVPYLWSVLRPIS